MATPNFGTGKVYYASVGASFEEMTELPGVTNFAVTLTEPKETFDWPFTSTSYSTTFNFKDVNPELYKLITGGTMWPETTIITYGTKVQEQARRVMQEINESTPIYDRLRKEYDIKREQAEIAAARDLFPEAPFDIPEGEWPNVANNTARALLRTLEEIQPSVHKNRTLEKAAEFNAGYLLAVQTLLYLTPEVVEE